MFNDQARFGLGRSLSNFLTTDRERVKSALRTFCCLVVNNVFLNLLKAGFVVDPNIIVYHLDFFFFDHRTFHMGILFLLRQATHGISIGRNPGGGSIPDEPARQFLGIINSDQTVKDEVANDYKAKADKNANKKPPGTIFKNNRAGNRVDRKSTS